MSTTELNNPAALERERLTSLVNSMADGVIATDERPRVVLYNGAALNVLDLNSSIEGQPLKNYIHLIDKNNQVVDLDDLIKNTKTTTTTRDLRLVYPDKSTINIYLSIATVHLGYGVKGERGFVLIFRDITREKSLEEERDEFISVTSHELRTPVAVAEGNISNAQLLLEKASVDPAVLDALEQAHTQVTYLSGLINDLSMLSRAERGKLQIDIEQINPHAMVEELITSQEHEAKEKGLDLKVDLDPSLESLYSSRLYVREILQNFLTNAVKYTQKGHITLGAKPKDNGVMFSVEDSGIGISKTDQEKIFDKFFRSEDFRTRETGGTGMGLYITMKLARLLNAEIDVESELNKGSRFSIFIPNLK